MNIDEIIDDSGIYFLDFQILLYYVLRDEISQKQLPTMISAPQAKGGSLICQPSILNKKVMFAYIMLW
jgi:hypothetical protein